MVVALQVFDGVRLGDEAPRLGGLTSCQFGGGCFAFAGGRPAIPHNGISGDGIPCPSGVQPEDWKVSMLMGIDMPVNGPPIHCLPFIIRANLHLS